MFCWSGVVANRNRGTSDPFHESRIPARQRAVVRPRRVNTEDVSDPAGRLLLALYDRWQGRADAAPPAGNVLCIGNRQGPAWTTGQDREKTSRGLGPEPRGARGRHPSEGVVNPHFGVDPATGGLGPLRKRQGHHDGDFTVLDGSFRDG